MASEECRLQVPPHLIPPSQPPASARFDRRFFLFCTIPTKEHPCPSLAMNRQRKRVDILCSKNEVCMPLVTSRFNFCSRAASMFVAGKTKLCPPPPPHSTHTHTQHTEGKAWGEGRTVLDRFCPLILAIRGRRLSPNCPVDWLIYCSNFA